MNDRELTTKTGLCPDEEPTEVTDIKGLFGTMPNEPSPELSGLKTWHDTPSRQRPTVEDSPYTGDDDHKEPPPKITPHEPFCKDAETRFVAADVKLTAMGNGASAIYESDRHEFGPLGYDFECIVIE